VYRENVVVMLEAVWFGSSVQREYDDATTSGKKPQDYHYDATLRFV